MPTKRKPDLVVGTTVAEVKNLPADDKDIQVITMYQNGDKIEDIIAATGVPKATIYWFLAKHNIPTNRVAKSAGNYVPASELLARYDDVLRENGVLRDKVAKLEAQVEWLEAFTMAVRPMSAGRVPARPRVAKP